MGASFGKAQKNDDLEPGELPDYNHRRSTKDGEGIDVCQLLSGDGLFLCGISDPFSIWKGLFVCVKKGGMSLSGLMTRKLWKVAALCILVAAICTGCKGMELGARAGGTAYTVTDKQGTVVEMPAKPHRILTLSTSTDEIVLGLVKPDHMVAVNQMLDDPISSNVVSLAQQVETKVRNPSVEEIVALQPDLVIVPDWGDVTRVQSLRDLGIKVVVCKGAKNLEEVQETVRLIAQAVGEPDRGEKLIGKMDSKLAEIQAKVAKIPEAERKSVVLISLMKSYGGIGCSFDDACQYAGVKNGMAKLDIYNGQAMTKEQLVAINPDYLFLPTYTNHGKYDIEKFRAGYLEDPALKSLKAIRNNGLRDPYEGYLYNCSQDFVFGVQEIAYQVYGDDFKQDKTEHLTAVDE